MFFFFFSNNASSALVTKSCSNSFATLWTVACQSPLPTGFSRYEYWSGLPFPSPGHLSDPGIKPGTLIIARVSHAKPSYCFLDTRFLTFQSNRKSLERDVQAESHTLPSEHSWVRQIKQSLSLLCIRFCSFWNILSSMILTTIPRK